MPETKTCPKCGAELPADAPRGICPKCLMQAGLANEQDAESGPDMKPTTHTSGFVPPAPEELTEHFPQLEILELLGKGGMGAVYKARQIGLDRLVALKIIKPDAAEDPAFSERFAREARALARLSHPHIVAVHDFGQAGPLYYLLMEYVDGLTLRQVLGTDRLDPSEALAVVPQICDALQYAHDQGVVHRDIKPENVLMDKKGRVKIADFGLAKMLGQATDQFTLTATYQVMGTPRYMAPEQIEQSHSVDHRADIYSLGVVFYEMLTGELPLGRFDPPSRKVQLDVRLDEVVLRTLEKEPQRRYQRAGDLKTDVETIVSEGPLTREGRPPTPVEQPLGGDLPDVDLDAARQAVASPATGLLITGILALLVPLILGIFVLPLLFLHLDIGVPAEPPPPRAVPAPNDIPRYLLDETSFHVAPRAVAADLLPPFLVDRERMGENR